MLSIGPSGVLIYTVCTNHLSVLFAAMFEMTCNAILALAINFDVQEIIEPLETNHLPE